jgi:predicted nucleic acid-binding protein
VPSAPEYLDSNVIIRAVTNDHPDHSPRAQAYLTRLAQPVEQATTLTEAVLVETALVLSSPRLYNLPRAQIAQLLTDVVSLPGLVLPDRDVYLEALAIYERSSVDFVDALNAAHSFSTSGVVVSFDKDYGKIPGARRIEP